MFATSLLSKFMKSPTQVHLGAAKRVLRYISGITNYGLWLRKDESEELQGYADSDWVGCSDDAESTSGYVFSFGSGTLSWGLKKQDVIAEAGHISAGAVSNQAIWLRNFLSNVRQVQSEATILRVDNKSAIVIAKNPVQHGRTNHINVKYHAIWEAEESKKVKLEHCSSKDQLADIMTKALPKGKFEKLRSRLGSVGEKSQGGVLEFEIFPLSLILMYLLILGCL